jgi:uncharacterized protein (UPF0262 family)
MTDETAKIVKITLDERTVIRRSPDIEHERKVAMFDLLEENSFRPLGAYQGPFHVHLGMEETRLLLEIRDTEDREQGKIRVSLSPFRRVIKDYFAICESYYNAIKSASPSQIEAIDMGRRGLHNEGSSLLRERIAEQIDVDLETARRLFTLICVLQIRG